MLEVEIGKKEGKQPRNKKKTWKFSGPRKLSQTPCLYCSEHGFQLDLCLQLLRVIRQTVVVGKPNPRDTGKTLAILRDFFRCILIMFAGYARHTQRECSRSIQTIATSRRPDHRRCKQQLCLLLVVLLKKVRKFPPSDTRIPEASRENVMRQKWPH